MKWAKRTLTTLALVSSTTFAGTALAQKSGGILRHRDSPASMSIHDEATWSTIMPMMGVFNNLVLYDQHVKQNSLQTIVPDLAAEWVNSAYNSWRMEDLWLDR